MRFPPPPPVDGFDDGFDEELIDLASTDKPSTAVGRLTTHDSPIPPPPAAGLSQSEAFDKSSHESSLLREDQPTDLPASAATVNGSATIGGGLGLRSPRSHISREMQAIKAAFERFDVDKNNCIDVAELGEFMGHMGYTLTRSDLETLIAQVSTTGAKELQFHEIVRLMQMYKEAAQFKLLEMDLEVVKEEENHEGKPTWERLLLLVPPMHTDSFAVGVWQCFMLTLATYVWASTLYADILSDSDFVTWFTDNSPAYAVVLAASVMDWILYLRTFMVPTTASRVARAIDFTTTVPFELLFVLAYDTSSAGTNTGAIVALRVLMHLKLLRLVSAYLNYFVPSELVQVNRRHVLLFCYFVPGFTTVCYLIAVTQLFTVVWYAVVLNDVGSTTYIQALFVVTYSITGVGYGVVDLTSDSQRILSSFYCLVAQALSAFVVGSIVNVLRESDVQGEGEHQIVEILRIGEIAGISDKTARDAIAFQDHLVRHKINDSYGDLLGNLPRELNNNITLFVKVRLIANDSVFRIAHRATQVALARQLSSSVLRPGEAVFTTGEMVHDMIFIGHGVIELVDSNGQRCSILRSGDHLNEGALLFGSEISEYTARCVTHCEVFVLAKKQYLNIRGRFPVFDLEMRRLSQFLLDKILEAQRRELEEQESATIAPVAVDMGNPLTSAPPIDEQLAVVDITAASNSQVIHVGPAAAEETVPTDGVRTPSQPSRSLRSRPDDAALPAAKPVAVDMTYTTTGGQQIDLGKLSSTFRITTNNAAAFSFRNKVATPRVEALNDEDRFAALARDDMFGRLEAGEEPASDSDDGGDSDSSSDDPQSGAPVETLQDEALLVDIEHELSEIERLLTHLEATRNSFSTIASGRNGSPVSVASPIGSMRLEAVLAPFAERHGSGRAPNLALPGGLRGPSSGGVSPVPPSLMDMDADVAILHHPEVRHSGELSGAP